MVIKAESIGMPLVSILMPAYNAESTIREAIDCVLQQSYPNFELIVVNDGSTDSTAKVLAEYGDRIQVVNQPNAGLATARNTGCRLARGEFMALMDADDRCQSNRIAVQMAVMQQFDDAVLCCSEFSAFDAQGLIAARYARQYYSMLAHTVEGLGSLFSQQECVQFGGNKFSVYLGNIYDDLVCGNFIHPGTILFPRRTFSFAGNFDESLRSHSDWEWIVRAARIGRIACVDSPLLEYRISPTQRSSSRWRAVRSTDMLKVVQKIWDADPDLAAGMQSRQQAQLGRLWLEAADALSDHDKVKAATCLRKSTLSYGYLKVETVKVFIKILTPHSLMRLIRHIRGRDASGAPLRS